MKKKQTLFFLLAILLIFLGVIVFFTYQFKIKGKAEVLNTTDKTVKMLYQYFEPDGMGIIENILENEQFTSEDLTMEQKLYISFKTLPQSKIMEESCSNFPNFTGIKEGGNTCGVVIDIKDWDAPYDDTNFITNTFKEEDLKNQFEIIFNKNEYKHLESFPICDNKIEFYQYNESNKKYFLMKIVPSGRVVGDSTETKLLKAIKNNNQITLTIEISEFQGGELVIKRNLNFIFELEDSNYIFKEAKKVN